jgi:hypothetical protein
MPWIYPNNLDGVKVGYQVDADGYIAIGVPGVNSTDNAYMRDVIGNKSDTNVGNSLYARVDELYDNFQEERFVYPSLAAGATIVSANANWAYGAYAEVVPVNTISNPFHVTIVSIESCDRDAVFQLELYQGAADTIISAVRFAVDNGFFGNQVYTIGSAEVPANARVRARIASSNGLAQIATITISIVYLEHN